jgi:hypothetical protein
MTMDRWSVIEEIFQSAVERPLSERNEYVAQACGDDAELTRPPVPVRDLISCGCRVCRPHLALSEAEGSRVAGIRAVCAGSEGIPLSCRRTHRCGN